MTYTHTRTYTHIHKHTHTHTHTNTHIPSFHFTAVYGHTTLLEKETYYYALAWEWSAVEHHKTARTHTHTHTHTRVNMYTRSSEKHARTWIVMIERVKGWVVMEE